MSTARRLFASCWASLTVAATPLFLVTACGSAQIGPDPFAGNFTPVDIPGCTGKCGVRTDCPAELGGNAKLTGVVNIPAGNLPLYNARVYIPSGTPPATPLTGATCDRCSNGDNAVAYATTAADGTFTLEGVPAGDNIPLIISVGKWRRTVTLPNIPPCGETKLDTTTTRLPRNKSEGNIPKIALTTGAADAMECLLRSNKLGLDDSEFTLPSGSGRVNLYAGGGYPDLGSGQMRTATAKLQSGFNGSTSATPLPAASPWWDQGANLNQYDILIMSCRTAISDGDPTPRPPVDPQDDPFACPTGSLATPDLDGTSTGSTWGA